MRTGNFVCGECGCREFRLSASEDGIIRSECAKCGDISAFCKFEDFIQEESRETGGREAIRSQSLHAGVYEGIPTQAKIGRVYFISDESETTVKIGYTTNSVEFRLSALQTGSPVKLKILASVIAAPEYEKSLHRTFGEYRKSLEWFHAVPELMEVIACLREDCSATP